MVKIEEGKFYRTRDGGKIGPMYKWNRDGAWEARVDGIHGGGLWKDDGSPYYLSAGCYDSPTLIEEWTEGPVRTVTRRIINRGVYDVVKVGHHDESKSTVAVELVPSSLGFMRTSEQLRSAAMVFSQLAEALDSNEETK